MDMQNLLFKLGLINSRAGPVSTPKLGTILEGPVSRFCNQEADYLVLWWDWTGCPIRFSSGSMDPMKINESTHNTQLESEMAITKQKLRGLWN